MARGTERGPARSDTELAQSEQVDLSKIASADPASWPKTVKLRVTTVFPVISQGKEIGKVNVPAGTEVKLARVLSDRAGVAYSADGSVANMGGTWVRPGDTDLVERAQNAKPAK